MEKYWSGKEVRARRPKLWQGLLLFFLVMVSYYTVIAWMQGKWGMYGLAATELYLLGLSLLAGRLSKVPFRELFPVRRLEWEKVLGVVLAWIGAYSLVIPITMTVSYFFPEEMFSVSEGLSSFIYTVPPILVVIITCLLPCICEEALHRGFLLKSLQSRTSKKWLLILCMGIFFGIFHGSVWRFLPTAMLGGVLTYLMLETENLLYPALFHFINNFVPSLLTQGDAGQAEAAAAIYSKTGIPLYFMGIYLGMACVAPFCLHTAGYLFRRGEPGRDQRYFPSNRRLVTLVVLTVLPVILGILLFFFGLGRMMRF